MGDRAAEGRGDGSRDVYVDPRVVAGHVSERIHGVLGDLNPVSAAQ